MSEKNKVLLLQKEETIYRQIVEQILTQIQQGYLKKGDKLLSIRKACAHYQASKTSVIRAYEQLCYDGILTSVEKQGFFVDVNGEHIRKKNQSVRKNLAVKNPYRYDLRSQSVDMLSFDTTLWKRYVKDALEQERLMSTYGDGQGESFLREVLSEYAYDMRGVLAKSEHIVVASSFQSLCYIVFGLLKREIVVGMCEAFLPLIRVCQDFNITYKIMKQDEDGVCISDLCKQQVNVFYLHTSSHGTLRKPITKTKRKQLLQWAKQVHGYILEDDHNGELHYRTHMEPAMQGFDQEDCVIYFGSFSRLLLPSIRISYMVLNEDLYQIYEQQVSSYSPSASKIEQYALAGYICDHHLQRQIKRLKKQYQQRSIQLEHYLKTYFPNHNIQLEECALQFYIQLEHQAICRQVLQEMEQQQIAIGIHNNELIVSFASISMNAMEEVIQLLYESYQKVLKLEAT